MSHVHHIEDSEMCITGIMKNDLFLNPKLRAVHKEATSTIIPSTERERYLNEFNKIKAKYPEPRDRMETPLEREARMNLVHKEMSKLFIAEERR